MFALEMQKIFGTTITVFFFKIYTRIILSERLKPLIGKIIVFRVSKQYDHIERKLVKKGYNATQVGYLLDKFYSIEMVKRTRIAQESKRIMYDNFVKWCEQSGIHQWEGREILERDFNIKL